MLPPHTRQDPEGFYAELGLDPAASPKEVMAAFRRKARELHPDVPGTGNTSAFVAIRRAYDVLSNRERRASYDQAARKALANASAPHAARQRATGPGAAGLNRSGGGSKDRGAAYGAMSRLVWRPRFADLPIPVWVGLGAFLCLCIIEAWVHLRSPPAIVSAGIRPNAALVAPLPPSARRAVLYGPNPVRLAGTPNLYVVPAAGATVLWRRDTERGIFAPVGQLPPFSSVQAIRLLRDNGLVEVLFDETTTRFVDSKRLTAGDADAAHRAYCGYNAGTGPSNGELLEQRGHGTGTIELENRTVQPAVVKLRYASGLVARSVFLAPGGHVDLADVPDGSLRADFAVGELWSRACNTFAAGMRARRMAGHVSTMHDFKLTIPSDQEAAADDIPDHEFERD